MTGHPDGDPFLHNENEQFRRLVEEVKDYAIFMLDLNGNVRTWNQGARHIKGYREAEIVGKHFSIFYPESDAEDGLPERLLDEARVQGRTEHEGWRVRNNGSQFWANVTITAIHDDDGDLQGFAKVTRDLTERVQHERRLEQFAQAVSHDLRQPLRTMTVNLELIEKRIGNTLDTEQQQLLEDAIVDCKRTRTMVDGLLQYVRVETGDSTIEAVDCNEVVTDAVRDLEALTTAHDAEISVGSLPTVRVDREQLHVVFLNLLENAVKYTEEESPEIHVDAKRTDGSFQLSVADTGMGIEQSEREEIFELFERSHRVHESDGIGLGLTLCKQIIEQHGGEIWVDSSPGEGSTFYFTLPGGSEQESPSGGPQSSD